MGNINYTVKKAGWLYDRNYHCCEATVLALSEHMGMKSDLFKYGSLNCNDIVEYDKNDPKAVELYDRKVKNEIYIPLTKNITQWILEELDSDDYV